jgi:hypothetical protein
MRCFNLIILNMSIMLTSWQACGLPTNKIKSSQNPSQSIKPNLIAILADDMQKGITRFEGHTIIKTSNADT